MRCCVTLILLYFGFSLNCYCHPPLRKYYYVNLRLSWADAQQYCRTTYTDLATIESVDDISRLKSSFSYDWAWIGLKDDPKSWRESLGTDINSWRWSMTGETSKTGYHNWKIHKPTSFQENENCVVMLADGKWSDAPCESSSFSLMCYHAKTPKEKTYVFISAKQKWSDARDYCRKHYTDLPMIESNEENNEVYSAKPDSATAWIGLYRVRWAWSDKSQSSFRYWRPHSPNNYDGIQWCISENELHEWDDDHCDVKVPFICHQVSKLKTMLRMSIETDGNITGAATNTQILHQVGAALASQGWTDFKLQWKIQPRKQDKETLTQPHCNLHF